MTEAEINEKKDDLVYSVDTISYLDENKMILDVEIEQTADTLVKDLMNTPCPICEYSLVSHGHVLLAHKNNTSLRGTNIKCNGCNQNIYMHYPISIPSFKNSERLL